MRITILTMGSRGDLQPYLALAVGLQKAAYSVCIASHTTFEPIIRSYGVDFAPVRSDPRELVASPDILRAKANIVRFILAVRQKIGPLFAGIFDDFWAACQGSEAIVASPTAANAAECAQQLRIPLILGFVQPLVPTRAFSSFFLPPFRYLPGVMNLTSHYVFEQILWQSVRTHVTRWRRRTLGLRGAFFLGPYRGFRAQGTPHLIACSPSVIPRPQDWPNHVHMTGFWYLDPPKGFRPPAQLQHFLDSGPPPVYVGFGSMAHEAPVTLTDVVAAALRRSNQRGLLATGWGAIQQRQLSEDIMQLGDIPHGWLFPRMAAIIHHGGAGTVAEVIRSGTPSVVVPFGGDQPHWGRVLLRHGVSPPPLPVDHVNPQSLAHAIGHAVNDPGLRRRARALRNTVRRENGVLRAVHEIGYYTR